MEASERIKKVRKSKGLSTYELSKLTNIPQSTISKIENGKRKIDIETLSKLAVALEVSIDRLSGESVSSIIETKLEELGMTAQDLAEKSKVPFQFIENLDNIVPDFEVDGGENCYTYVSSIAWVLGLPGSTLRAALARQEAPVYEGEESPTSPDEAFKDFEDIEFDDNDNLKDLTKYYNQLNSNGQSEAVKRVEELTYIDKYKKPKA